MVKKDSFIRRAKLIRIKDGDTQVFLIDTGYHCRSEVSIRLQGVDTPETFRPKDKDERRRGMAAKKFVRKWFKDHKHGEKKWPLWIKTQMTKKEEPTIRMTLTRYVGSIYCTQGHFLAEAIIEAGHIK